MKRLLLLAVSLLLPVLACQPAEPGGALDELQQVRDQHVDAILEQSVEEELATYTDSAVVVPPDHQGVIGTQEIRPWLQGFFDNFTVEQLEISLADHTVQGDLAVAHYRYSWTLAPAGGGEPVRDTGQGLWVVERQTDGSWLIGYDIWNSDG